MARPDHERRSLLWSYTLPGGLGGVTLGDAAWAMRRVVCALLCRQFGRRRLANSIHPQPRGGVKPTGSPIQQTPSGEFDLAGVESICQTRSGESGSMEPGGRFWRIWNAPPPRVRSPTVIVSVLADLPRLREERMENGNISRACPAGGGRAAAGHPAVRHPLGRS